MQTKMFLHKQDQVKDQERNANYEYEQRLCAKEIATGILLIQFEKSIILNTRNFKMQGVLS